jgi:hypothetical protein
VVLASDLEVLRERARAPGIAVICFIAWRADLLHFNPILKAPLVKCPSERPSERPSDIQSAPQRPSQNAPRPRAPLERPSQNAPRISYFYPAIYATSCLNMYM